MARLLQVDLKYQLSHTQARIAARYFHSILHIREVKIIPEDEKAVIHIIVSPLAPNPKEAAEELIKFVKNVVYKRKSTQNK